MNKDDMSSELKFLVSRLNDICKIAAKQSIIKAGTFMDPAEQEACCSVKPDPDINVLLWGGYPDAERRMYIAAPEYYNELELKKNVSVIKVENNYDKKLSHRDYLGSVLGLGIKREKIGDILVSNKNAHIICCADISEFIKDNLAKVGNISVKTSIVPEPELGDENYKLIEFTVASLRLDAVLAGVMKCSRSKASESIKNGIVNVNYKKCENISHVLSKDDLISVKGFGRIRVNNIGTVTKKGRIHICIKQFI